MKRIKSIEKFNFDVFGPKSSREAIKKQTAAFLKAYDGFRKAEFSEIIIVDLMRFAGMSENHYVHGTTGLDLAHQDGKRAVIHYLLSMCDLTEIEFLQRLAASKRIKENVNG